MKPNVYVLLAIPRVRPAQEGWTLIVCLAMKDTFYLLQTTVVKVRYLLTTVSNQQYIIPILIIIYFSFFKSVISLVLLVAASINVSSVSQTIFFTVLILLENQTVYSAVQIPLLARIVFVDHVLIRIASLATQRMNAKCVCLRFLKMVLYASVSSCFNLSLIEINNHFYRMQLKLSRVLSLINSKQQ